MSQKTSSGKTINFWITYSEDQATSADLLDQCYIDDKGRLALVMGKTDIAIRITCTDKINQVQFGKMDCLLNGAPNDGDYQFGNEVNGITDFAGIGSTDNYFIAGQSSSGFAAANGVFTTSIHYNNDQRTWFIGPQVIVRTEPITLEALTHADHNVIARFISAGITIYNDNIRIAAFRTLSGYFHKKQSPAVHFHVFCRPIYFPVTGCTIY